MNRTTNPLQLFRVNSITKNDKSTPIQYKSIIEIPITCELPIKAEKAGYKLWEEDIIIEEGESMTILVEMEKGGEE